MSSVANSHICLHYPIKIRVVPDTDLAGYSAWPDTGYPEKLLAGYPAAEYPVKSVFGTSGISDRISGSIVNVEFFLKKKIRNF